MVVITKLKLIILMFILSTNIFHINSFAAYSNTKEPFNVLILNAYHQGFTWTDLQVKGILDVLEDSQYQIDISIEYLDWKRFPTQDNLDTYYELLKTKYASQTIDLIITTDDIGLQFAVDYREEIFSYAPIIYGSVFQVSAQHRTFGEENIAGIYEDTDASGTVDIILNSYGTFDVAYVITEYTESGTDSSYAIEDALKNIDMPVRIIHLQEYSFEFIKDILANPEPNSVAIMASYSTDATGMAKSVQYYCNEAAKVSEIPIYGVNENSLGHGIVGGSLLSAEIHGQDIANLALSYFSGTPINELEPKNNNSVINAFDYNYIIKHHINMTTLPKNSLIINEPFSFFRAYKQIILYSIGVILILVGFIIFLLINTRIKKQMQTELHSKNKTLQEYYEELSASEEILKHQNEELLSKQDQLKSNELRYRLVIESTKDIIWEWNIDNGTYIISNKVYALLGYKDGSIINISDWINLIHPDDVDKVNTTIKNYLNKLTDIYSCEYRVKKVNGSYIWVLSSGIAINNSNDDYYLMFGSYSDITNDKVYQERISYLAYNDSLTSLPNRLNIKEYIETAFSTCKNSEIIVLFFIDLDNFKDINNSYGHKYGDLVLVEIANRFKLLQSRNSYIGRIGGDEFIFIKKIKATEPIDKTISQLENIFSSPLEIYDNNIYVTSSIGYAIYPEDGNNYDELLIKADLAMYKIKESGKRKIARFSDNMNISTMKKMAYQNHLHKAIEKDELYLVYQPQIKINNDEIEGFEALIRWNNSEYGIIPPNEFISIAEISGLIIPIGEWIIKTAFEFSNKINKQSTKKIIISINLSVIQLLQENFSNIVEDIMNETKVDPSTVVFEITESIYARSFNFINKNLNQLRSLGTKIALDDFGTGYSSLTYLRKLPLSVLKIDKSFIIDILDSNVAHLL